MKGSGKAETDEIQIVLSAKFSIRILTFPALLDGHSHFMEKALWYTFIFHNSLCILILRRIYYVQCHRNQKSEPQSAPQEGRLQTGLKMLL